MRIPKGFRYEIPSTMILLLRTERAIQARLFENSTDFRVNLVLPVGVVRTAKAIDHASPFTVAQHHIVARIAPE